MKYNTIACRSSNILLTDVLEQLSNIFLHTVTTLPALCRIPGQCEMCVLLGLGLIGLVKRQADMMP